MKAKKQHYVPQFLLRNFADEDGRVYVFDKRKQEVRSQSVRKVAAENYFYDYDHRAKSIENDLARLEFDSSKVVNRIIQHKRITNSINKKRRLISFFVATQLLRTRQQRQFHNELRDQIASLVKDGEFSNSWLGDLEGWDDREELSDWHVIHMKLVAPFIAAQLENKSIYLLRADEGDLMISDNPAVVWNDEDGSGFGPLESRSEIFLPLTPFLLLLMVDAGTHIAGNGQIVLGKEKVPRLGDRAVYGLNVLQIFSSERFLFSSRNDFTLAEFILKKNPEWVAGPRPDIQETIELLQEILYRTK